MSLTARQDQHPKGTARVRSSRIGAWKARALALGGYRALARAYAYKQDIPMAELATAQGFLAEGNAKDAKLHAARAQAKLKYGSPAWLRADDIVSFKPPKKS